MSDPMPKTHTETIKTDEGALVSFRMIEVSGGTFDMGADDEDAYDNEKPIHKVKVSDFWMGEFPVTQALWQAILSENPSYFAGLDRPVEQVSWNDITNRFLPALNERCRQKYRLPTEAEWEYAARGGKHKSPYVYSGSNRLKDVAWHDANSHDETKQVGLKQPNALKLFDLSGNVYEWCSDLYDEFYYETCVDEGIIENRVGPIDGHSRVLRGGSWAYFDRVACRVSYRLDFGPWDSDKRFGFRLVVSSLQ